MGFVHLDNGIWSKFGLGIGNTESNTEAGLHPPGHATVLILPDTLSGRSRVSQNKLPQLILGCIYILKYLQSNFIG